MIESLVGSSAQETLKHLVFLVSVFASMVSAQQVERLDASTPRETQIQILKLAAPKEVTDSANIYVLGKSGYELAVRGSNGFSCAVEREKPNTMEPECYDQEGSKTTFRVRQFVERQRAKGESEEKIEEAVRAGYKAARFKPPSKPGIVYMLSDFNRVLDPQTNKIIHFPGHLMFYAPFATEATVGSGAGAPYIVHPGSADALLIVIPAKR